MGGRGAHSSIRVQRVVTPQTQAPQQPQIQPVQQPQTAAQQANAQAFADTDSRPFHDLVGGRAYYQAQTFDIDTRTSLADYLDPNTVPGSLYNASQNMNYALIHGTMTPQQQYMYDSITNGMHNLGQNLNLTRYDHRGALDDMLSQVTHGAMTDSSGMSVSALKKALVGGSFTDKRVLSTSMNNFKNAQDPSTFTTREVKIVFKAKASTQALMPGIGRIPMQGSSMRRGDDFGEILLAPTANGHNNYHIADVRKSGSRARGKGGSTSYLDRDQIEIVLETD